MSVKRIYFDNNATTKIDDKVLTKMTQIYQNPLNSSSIHRLGQMACGHINESKEQIADLLNAKNYQTIFNSGSTESNNMALRGFKNYQIITSKSEHLSVLEVAKNSNAIFVEIDDVGLVKIDQLEEIIKKIDTKNFLVSIMLANNETGVIQEMKDLAKLVHKYGGLIHSDITQGVGKIQINLEDLNIDLASLSAHKIYGPQGIGALLVRNGLDIEPLIYGGMQEDGKRAGTANVPAIAGFGEACKIAKESLVDYPNIANIRDYLEDNLSKIASNDIKIFSKAVKRLPNTSFFANYGLDNQALMINFDLNDIAVSTGSACSSGVVKPSHVLDAMGIDQKEAKSAIRVSLGKNNNKKEINQFIEIWQDFYKKNKKL